MSILLSGMSCSRQASGRDFDCFCGEAYFLCVEQYQLDPRNEREPDFTAEQIAQIIDHQSKVDRRLCSRIVKLYDVIASAERGFRDISGVVERVLKALVIVYKSNNNSAFFLSVVSSCLLNYRTQFQDLLNQELFKPLELEPWDLLTSQLDNLGCEALFQALLDYCESGNHLKDLLVKTALPPEHVKKVCQRLLFRSGGLKNWASYTKLVCFICSGCDWDIVQEMFRQVLTLWSDPVVAKGYVFGEVLHYTKLSVMFFSHLSPSQSLEMQEDLIRFVAQGLPNHFSSSDHRSIQLAKFFCELLTESLKLYEKRIDVIPHTLCNPAEDINHQLLTQGVHKCDNSETFWRNFQLGQLSPTFKESPKAPAVSTNDVEDDDDDEDDDDFEPIETLDAPVLCKVAYIRDFLESFAEEKPYDEWMAIFAALPNIARHQVSLEHPQLGIDLLNKLVRWENDFDCAQMETLRKRSLCQSLSSKMDGNVQHLCHLFSLDETRVPQQILIIDVLSTAAAAASLADLQILAKSAFEIMLRPDLFETRDVPLRVPLILFYHRLLSTMPVQMIRPAMVNDYLKALTCLTRVDKATEQTVSYSLHKLVDKLRDIQFSNDEPINQDLSTRLAEMRSWMWNLQNQNASASIHNVSNAL